MFILVSSVYAGQSESQESQEEPTTESTEVTLSNPPTAPSSPNGDADHVELGDSDDDHRTLEEQYGHYRTPPPSYEEGLTRPRVVRVARPRETLISSEVVDERSDSSDSVTIQNLRHNPCQCLQIINFYHGCMIQLWRVMM